MLLLPLIGTGTNRVGCHFGGSITRRWARPQLVSSHPSAWQVLTV